MSNPYTHPDPVATVNTTAVDPIVEAVRAKLHQRSQLGQQKYGTMLTRTDLSRLDWLRHLQEELMDAACYAETLIQAEDEVGADDTTYVPETDFGNMAQPVDTEGKMHNAPHEGAPALSALPLDAVVMP